MHSFSPIPQSDSIPVFQSTVVAAAVVAPPSTPAFLSRFPRSLSSLSLGTKKKPSEKDSTIVASTTTTSSSNTPVSSPNTSFQSPGDSPYAMNTPSMHHHHSYMHHHPHSQAAQRSSVGNYNADAIGPTHKKKFGYGQSIVESNDVPPPLPQRNMPRKSSDCGVDMFGSDVNLRRSQQVSDLDHSQCAVALTSPIGVSAHNNAMEKMADSGGSGKGKSRSKNQKIKALSDPKMSSQMFIEMEQSLGGHNDKEPPPLPPRQPGMLEEKQNIINNNKFGSAGGANYGNRPPPNSIDTLMNYPLTTTTQAVRDNFAAFPLSHRPNVQQILQQQSYNSQQQLQPNSSATTSAATTVLSKSTVSNLLSHTNTIMYTHTQVTLFFFLICARTKHCFQAHSKQYIRILYIISLFAYVGSLHYFIDGNHYNTHMH